MKYCCEHSVCGCILVHATDIKASTETRTFPASLLAFQTSSVLSKAHYFDALRAQQRCFCARQVRKGCFGIPVTTCEERISLRASCMDFMVLGM